MKLEKKLKSIVDYYGTSAYVNETDLNNLSKATGWEKEELLEKLQANVIPEYDYIEFESLQGKNGEGRYIFHEIED